MRVAELKSRLASLLETEPVEGLQNCSVVWATSASCEGTGGRHTGGRHTGGRDTGGRHTGGRHTGGGTRRDLWELFGSLLCNSAEQEVSVVEDGQARTMYSVLMSVGCDVFSESDMLLTHARL